MAIDPQVPLYTDAEFNAFTGVTFNDPKVYSSHDANKILARFFLKPIQDEVLNLIQLALNGGAALPVRNATGSTIVAGPVRVTGYDATNLMFNIALADADTNSPAHFLLLTSLATATNGVAYISGSYVSALDTTAISIGTEVFLSSTGIATVTAPTGADQIIQSIGFTTNQNATGTIRGMIQRPVKFGTSWLQDSAVTAGKIASDAVTTAKVLNANITAEKMVNAGVFTGDAVSTFPTITIGAGAITDSKITSMSASKLTGALPAAQMPALTGDVTNTAGMLATTIANNAVTNAKAAQMAANTIKGNNAGITADAVDMTVAQTKTLLAIAASDVSGLAASATTNTVDASNITSGTLPIARIGSLAITDAKINDVATSKLTGLLPAANLPSMIGFRAVRATSYQTLTTSGTWYKVQFNDEKFDTDSAYDPSTNYRFTSPKSGYYAINACVTWQPGNASGWTAGTVSNVVGLRIVKNSTVISTIYPAQANSTNGFCGVFSDIVYLASGDTLHVEAFADYNSATIYYQQEATFFSGAFIGA